MSVTHQLNAVEVSMKDVTENMRSFSLCMRSLSAERTLHGSSDTAKEMNKIRNDTRKDALLYVKYILPASIELVRTFQEFFQCYETLSQKEWKELLPYILEEVRGYTQFCIHIIKRHEYVMTRLKKRKHEAEVLIAEVENLTKKLERKKADLEESASIKNFWATLLCFVPGVNLIATPLLAISAQADLAQSMVEGDQCNINNAAVFVVSDTMIPALLAFNKGLDSIAGFFNVIESRCITTFQSKGEKALENHKTLHYIMMKKKAKEIKQSCTEFFDMIPWLQTEFLCIPQ